MPYQFFYIIITSRNGFPSKFGLITISQKKIFFFSRARARHEIRDQSINDNNNKREYYYLFITRSRSLLIYLFSFNNKIPCKKKISIYSLINNKKIMFFIF